MKRAGPSAMMAEAGGAFFDGFRQGFEDAQAHPLSPPDATPDERLVAFLAYYGPGGPGEAVIAQARRMASALFLGWVDDADGEAFDA